MEAAHNQGSCRAVSLLHLPACNAVPVLNAVATVLAVAAILFAAVPSAAQQRPAHIVAVIPEGQQPQVPANPHLNYYGGPVVSNLDLVLVYWGNNVSDVVTGGIQGFYNTILPSNYLGMLTEYNVKLQKIGLGSMRGPFTINPSKCAVGPCNLNDTDISAEIQTQVNANNLPKPASTFSSFNQNTMYMVYFPPKVVISLGNDKSCVVFCAYHNTFAANFGTELYGVMPDFGPGSGCDRGCGGGTQFQNVTAVSSHEFTETITDADVGFAQVLGPPLAWYDPNFGEIGDICNGQHTVVLGYTVQKEWSNAHNACVP
jgi:hypothetical protein